MPYGGNLIESSNLSLPATLFAEFAMQPILIIVAGPPGAGKTTLAHLLARTLRCPALCRDEFKEGLVLTHGTATPDDANLRIYEIFFQSVELLLRGGISLVAEAAFQHKLWAPKLAPLQHIAKLRLVICTIDPARAQARALARGVAEPERALLHGNRDAAAGPTGVEIPIADWQAPQLAVPTLVVDTSDGYDPRIAAIAAFCAQPAVR